MLNSVGANANVGEIQQVQTPVNKQYVTMRGRSGYERTPDSDSFESSGGKGKTGGVIAGLIATTAAVVGGICFHKGNKALGKDAKFLDKLKKGWEEVWNDTKGKFSKKGKKTENDTKTDKPAK